MDLRQFLERINQAGELSVIEGAHWDLEIGALTYLAAQQPSSRAILFDRIPGYAPGFRVLASACANERRTNLLLGFPVDTLGLELVKNLREKLREPVKPLAPVEVREGPVLENVCLGDDVDLFMLPSPRWQSLDGGRYVGTGDTVITRDPDEDWVNVGVHRIQVHDKTTATIMFEPGKHGDIIRRKYWRKGMACPVAVTLGGDPLHVTLAASRVPWGVSEYGYMGWWRKEPVRVVRGPLTGLPVPADAEIVLEGEILPPEQGTLMEGPFLEWSGHFTPGKPETPFRVRSILYRHNPIILAELSFLGAGIPTGWGSYKAAAELWNHLDTVVPGVKGVWLPMEFGNGRAVVISLEQKYSGHAKQAALAALGHVNMNRKFIIVVDEDVDPSNIREVLFAVSMKDGPESWDIVRGCRTAVLDPLLTPEQRETGDHRHAAIIIMACRPYHLLNSFPPAMKRDLSLEKKLKEKWPDLRDGLGGSSYHL